MQWPERGLWLLGGCLAGMVGLNLYQNIRESYAVDAPTLRNLVASIQQSLTQVHEVTNRQTAILNKIELLLEERANMSRLYRIPERQKFQKPLFKK